ncbi:oxygen-independent coproporphyrinogen III oxidase [Candidatus Thiosymbion oneisti]|uniref:oxygen-independent coproporphyrinogen III oxidase n=1 Tax=Candidatus Thiosymbion oneisti TaxID=589554 RepID=UPI000B164DEA|nr:oxygen-independent coproporphyrinogen III oxidase [Candidatus Thiosymbion oneisti]
MDQTVAFDLALIRRYDQSGPRYTSYPTAVEFHDGFGEPEYRRACARSNSSGRPLSLYVHIPFCDTVCFYCACNKIATKDRSRAQPYLEWVYRELELQGALFGADQTVEQLHWGGGTPTFISRDQMRELMDHTRRRFRLAADEVGEYAIEIDPREADAQTVVLLRRLGFNRMSLGVQDLDPVVQKAVNRIQTEGETLAVLEAARAEGFRSISIDLIYGLPFQTVDGFIHTLERIVAFAPDRLSVFNYAHLPQRFMPQRRINEADLPSPHTKLDILKTTGELLTDAGYIYIGMDHFARPDDELAVAQRSGSLYRNFQGYSTHADCDLIGIGMTSIGKLDNSYSQNRRTLDEYCRDIDAGCLPVFQGIELSRDDEIRRDVITRLICNFALDVPNLEQTWGIEFADYFSDELPKLAPMQEDGLLTLDEQQIRVLPKGRLLIRNICMAFDAYRAAKKDGPVGFSKVI